MSSEKGWVRWEGQCKVRMARSGGKGNVKLALQYQVGRAMSSKNSWVRLEGQY